MSIENQRSPLKFKNHPQPFIRPRSIHTVHGQIWMTLFSDSVPVSRDRKHRVLTPYPPERKKYPLLPTGIGEGYSQTISNLCQAVLLRRCELPLQAKCWTNSVVPLVILSILRLSWYGTIVRNNRASAPRNLGQHMQWLVRFLRFWSWEIGSEKPDTGGPPCASL